jgi:hypothetical protein
MGQVLPPKYEPGRRRVRHARQLKSMPAEREYVPCRKDVKCKHDCTYVTASDRTLLYKEYKLIREDVRVFTWIVTLTQNLY